MCTKVPPSGRQSGWTMAEFMVAAGVASVLVVALVSLTLYTSFSFAGILNYIELEAQSQQTLDRMIMDVREAARLTAFTSNRVDFVDTGSNTLAFAYDSGSRKLTRTKNGESTTLLTECDDLNFSIFQRTPKATNIYELTPTSLASTNTKALQVRWTCSRKILGSRLNTETVQSTKIVLRN